MVFIWNCHRLRYALISPCSWFDSPLDEFNRLRMRLTIRLDSLQSRRWLAENVIFFGGAGQVPGSPSTHEAGEVDRQNVRHMGVALACA